MENTKASKGPQKLNSKTNPEVPSFTDLGAIIKSPLDARRYKALQLPNGLKVLLMSTLDIPKTNIIKSNKTCHLQKVLRFNKAYLGLGTDTIKVRCECQTEAPKMMDKSTSTCTDPELDVQDEATALMSEAMKAIRGLLLVESTDTVQTNPSEEVIDAKDKNKQSEPDKSQLASAYLTVGAGWFNDPDDMPGLAHFCEHCVFLGSKKFPAPNQIFRLILPHDGYVNAYTTGPQTVYTISTSVDIFAVGLEMLGDMVGFPLFPKTLVSKEIEALDSEFSLRQEDIPKYFQLVGSLTKEGHPLRKMDAGNRETLRVPNFYRKLLDWKSVHYCANYMTLCIEAPLTISEMTNLILEYFSEIQSSKLPSPRTRIKVEGCPFDPKVFHRVYHVPSIYHSDFMIIHWALEAAAWKNLITKPLEYLSAVMSYKGEGSIYNFLNRFGWATNVMAECWNADVTCNNYTSLYSIHIDLTEEGFKYQDYIVEAVFSFIHMMIKNGPSESYFQECQKQLADDFHRRSLRYSGTFAEPASQWLQSLPPKFVLVAPQLMSHYDPELIKKYTQMLEFETCNIMIFSQKFRETKEKLSNVETNYKTPYASYEFPPDLADKVNTVKQNLCDIFCIPPPNIYIQEVTCCGNQQKNMIRNGPLMVIKGKCAVHYKDAKFQIARGQLPQAKYVFSMQSPISYYGRAGETLMKLFANFLNQMIESQFAAPLSANLRIKADVSHQRLQITLIGPSNRLPQITKDVFKIFTLFEKLLNRETYENEKRAYTDMLEDIILDNRWFAWDIVGFLWSNYCQLSCEYRAQAEKLEFKQFKQFVKTFKNRMYIVGELYGFITSAQAFNVVQTVGQLIKKYPQQMNHSDIAIHYCPQFPIGENIVRIKSRNPAIHTSVIINGYQCGNLTTKDDKIANFLARTMSDAAYYQLRTNEQLGYIVIVYHDMSYTATSLLVELVTQPKNYSTDYCNARIDKFIVDFYNANLSDHHKFQNFLKGKPKVDFTLEEIQTLYRSFLLPNPQLFRKMSIQIVGAIADNFPSVETSNEIEMPEILEPFSQGNGNDFNIMNGANKNAPNVLKNRDQKGNVINRKNNMDVISNGRKEGRYLKCRFRSSRNSHLKSLTTAISVFPRYRNNPSFNAFSDSREKPQQTLNNKDNSQKKGTPPTAVYSRRIKDINEFKNSLDLFDNVLENRLNLPDDDSVSTESL